VGVIRGEREREGLGGKEGDQGVEREREREGEREEDIGRGKSGIGVMDLR